MTSGARPRWYWKQRFAETVVADSRCARWTAGGLVMVLAGCAVNVANAQVASSFDELLRSRALRSGDEVYVTDAYGRRMEADVVDVASNALTFEDERRRWTLEDREIAKIERRDSLHNGTAIGVLAGVATAYAACKMQRHSDQCVYGVVYIGYPAIAIGAVAGAIIDANFWKVVYRRSADVAVSPFLSVDGVGARMTVGW